MSSPSSSQLTGQVYFVASIVGGAVGLLPGGGLRLLLLKVQVRVGRAVGVQEGDLGGGGQGGMKVLEY